MNECEIRLITKADVSPLFNLINNSRETIGEFLPWALEVKKIEDEVFFVKNALKELEKGTMYPFVIEKNNNVVGMIDLHDIDRRNKHADIGYWLGNEYVGQGIMSQSVKQIELYGFEKLNLHKLTIQVEPDNVKSINVARNAGFRYEGTLEDDKYVNGKFHTFDIYSLINLN